MNKITFSHNYRKLREAGVQEGSTVCLIEVINVNLEQLSQAFLNFDTDNGTYELPTNGRAMLLIFKAELGIFTTLRRWTPQKERYYRSQITHNFTLQINE